MTKTLTLNIYHLQLKTKEDVGGGLGLQRGGRQFTWRWKSKCLLNKCLLGQSETGDAERSGDSSLSGIGPLSIFC